MNGRLPPRKNPAIRPQPARQRLSLRIRLERLVLPEARWPRSGGSRSTAAVAPTLISLVRVRTSLKREHARRRPAHQHQEVGDPGPKRDAGQDRQSRT